jgi:radical SAM protein with 4Fe4S-binding SPASM domain
MILIVSYHSDTSTIEVFRWLRKYNTEVYRINFSDFVNKQVPVSLRLKAGKKQIIIDNIVLYYHNLISNNKLSYCQTIKESIRDLHFKIFSKAACAAGFSSYTFNADGTIYTCQHFANESKDSCGNIESGINEETVSKYRSPFLDNLKMCKFCWCRYLCGGCCFAEKYAVNGDISINISEKCELERMKWEKMLILSQMINESNPQYFKNLIKEHENIA